MKWAQWLRCCPKILTSSVRIPPTPVIEDYPLGTPQTSWAIHVKALPLDSDSGVSVGSEILMLISAECRQVSSFCLNLFKINVHVLAVMVERPYLCWRPPCGSGEDPWGLVTSGQSYKQFMLVIYDSRVVIWGIFKSGTTLES